MKRFALVLALPVFALTFAAGQAHADTLQFTINNPNQTATPGSTLEFDATVSAPSNNTATIYLNGDTYDVAAPLTIDDSDFLNFPLSLDPGASYTGALFTIDVPLNASGVYNDSFQIEGGSNANADLTLNSANFTVTTSAANVTPEPSSLVLLGTGLVGALGAMRRRLA